VSEAARKKQIRTSDVYENEGDEVVANSLTAFFSYHISEKVRETAWLQLIQWAREHKHDGSQVLIRRYVVAIFSSTPIKVHWSKKKKKMTEIG